MLTDPVQEDIFQEEEFVEIRYRETLMPLWMKLLIGLGVLSSFMMCILMVAILFIDKKNNGAAELVVTVALVSVFLTGGIAGIQMFNEKKWAIYGITGSALLHLLIFWAGLTQVSEHLLKNEVYSLLIPLLVMLAFLLIFLIRIVFIFKRWLAYQPSVKPKR